MKYVIVIILVLAVAAVFVFRNDMPAGLLAAENTKSEQKKDKKVKDKGTASQNITVNKTWDLPDRLKEISGLQYLDENRFACVQDEEGVIFIYNVQQNKIEKEISFAGAGDYEGLAIAGNNAYVVRSDGQLYEINNWQGKPEVTQHKTGLTDHNVEGLFYDASYNRLLLAIKDDEPGGKDYKGVYAFDINGKKMNAEPVYKLMVENGGKKKKLMKPSDIARHPSTSELYVLDGPASKLVVLDASGKLKQTYNLGNAFEQPEGISFNTNGDMFISNEGVKGSGNIKQVTLR